MEAKRFDLLARGCAGDTSRRQVLGRLLGATAALLTGATLAGSDVARAKKGKGKAKGHGKGKKNGQPKVALCHNGHTIRVAAPAVDAHLQQGATEGACA